MQQNKIPLGFGTMSKGLKIGLITFLSLLILGGIAIAIFNKIKEAELLKTGVRVSGYVVSKTDQTSGKRNSPKHTYYFKLDLVEESADTTKFTQAKKENKSFDEKIDALLADSKKRMEYHKSYASVSVMVSSDTYYKYFNGDKVRVIHLKDLPETARVLDDLE